MGKKDRLKNGLDMLFEDNFHEERETPEEGADSPQQLRISLIEPDKEQPRTQFDAEKLNVLAENIAQHGVLQPILVRPSGSDSYKIVAGERRWRAARIAGLSEIPAVIKEMSDLEAAQFALIENLQREDLNPIEEAKAYRRLMDSFGMTQESVAKSVGKSRSAVANSVRMLKLSDDMQKAVENGGISVGHAKILVGIDDEELCKKAFDECVKKSMTVSELSKYVEQIKTNSDSQSAENGNKSRADEPKFGDAFKSFAFETEKSLKDSYGIKSNLKKEKSGKITLKLLFNNEEELNEILSKL